MQVVKKARQHVLFGTIAKNVTMMLVMTASGQSIMRWAYTRSKIRRNRKMTTVSTCGMQRSDIENSEDESAGSSHFDDRVGTTRPDDFEAGVEGTCNPERHDHQDEDAYWYGWEAEDYLVIPRDDWEEPHFSGLDSEASASTRLDPKADPTQAIKDMLNVKGAGA